MDKPEDILYLKQFVKQHPDNKMGWYLLGKHYRTAGKEGKANYCFIQAGDIYDAYEQQSHPLAEQQMEQLREWGERQKKRRLTRKLIIAGIPLLLLALFLPLKDTLRQSPQPSKPVNEATIQSANPATGVVLVPLKESRPLGYAMNRIVAAGKDAPDMTLAARLEEQDGWQQWNGKVRFLMSVEQQYGRSQLDVAMYDREACICDPVDAAQLGKSFKDWRKRQELHWTLASGIAQYERMYGKWPSRLNDLIRPYPNNILSGEGEGMSDIFPYVLSRLKARKATGTIGSSNSADNSRQDDGGSPASNAIVGSNGLFDTDWSKPLEIIVDTSTHQLIVVQNKMVVRSYKVGLGGNRTPEGVFYISEKVRDPIGTEEGMFGSRGMTLSGTLFAIHGTNRPDSIGGDESLGCVRMDEADVEELYDMVPLGTTVTIKNGKLPFQAKQPEERFKLEPRENETNPAKVYQWLT